MFRLPALVVLALSLFSCAGSHNRPDCRLPSSGREDCFSVMCPALAPPRCGPKEKIARDGEGCCPKLKCVPRTGDDCARVRCAMRMPNCPRGEKAVDLREDGACCPRWSCEEEGDSNEEL